MHFWFLLKLRRFGDLFEIFRFLWHEKTGFYSIWYTYSDSAHRAALIYMQKHYKKFLLFLHYVHLTLFGFKVSLYSTNSKREIEYAALWSAVTGVWAVKYPHSTYKNHKSMLKRFINVPFQNIDGTHGPAGLSIRFLFKKNCAVKSAITKSLWVSQGLKSYVPIHILYIVQETAPY